MVEVIKVHKLNKQQHRQLVPLVDSLDKMGYYVMRSELSEPNLDLLTLIPASSKL